MANINIDIEAFKKLIKEGLKGEINIDELTDEELQALAVAYIMDENKEEADEEEQEGNQEDSDVDNLDFNNFKGIYFNDDPNRKYQDPHTGCHFEYLDLCKRMIQLKQLRKEIDKELGLPLSKYISKSASQQLKEIQEIKFEDFIPKNKPSKIQPNEDATIIPVKQQVIVKKQPPQQIIKLQKNQIKEVPGAFNNNQGSIQLQNQSISKIQLEDMTNQNDLRDRLVLSTGGQGSAPNNIAAVRSKSQDKAGQLLTANNQNVDRVQAQYSYRGNQMQNNYQLQSQNPSLQYNGMHLKQKSQYQQMESMQRGISQAGTRKSNPNTGSIVEMPSKISLMSASKNEGSRNRKRQRADAASASFALQQFKNSADRRTIDGIQPIQFYHVQQPSQQNIDALIRSGSKHQKGRQSQSIYLDDIHRQPQVNQNRQFRNSNFQSAKASAIKKSMINQTNRNQKLSIDQLKMQLLNAGGSRNNYQNPLNPNIANTVYGNLVSTGQTHQQPRKSRNQAGSLILPQSLSINYNGQGYLINQTQQEQNNLQPYFIKSIPQSQNLNQQTSKMASKHTLGQVDVENSGVYTQKSQSRNNHQQPMKSQDLLLSAQRQNNMFMRPQGLQVEQPSLNPKKIIPTNHHIRKSYGGAAQSQQTQYYAQIGVRDSQSRDKIQQSLGGDRPITSGKIGIGSIISNQNIMNMLGQMNNQILNVGTASHIKKERSRQQTGNGLFSQLPSQQAPKYMQHF